jgi:uncharacterized phage protein (TIGR02218 family)
MKDVSAGYIAKEEATQRRPAELYHMWRDGGEHWRYTSGDTTVTYDGEDYVPAALERSQVRYDSGLETVTMSIKAAYVMDTVLQYISTNPVEILWISVMKLHRDQIPLEVDVVFIGQIKDVSFKGIQANIVCVGFDYFLKQTVPRWRYQLTCNHILFDSKCSLIKADYKVSAVVTLDATKTIISSATFGDSEFGDNYFTRGELVFGVESRTVVSHIGFDITLMYKMKELEDNDTVDVYPGCDKRLETCRDKFDNIGNSLAFPFIPLENPAIRVP